jgi:hypothetical protein
MNWLFWTAFALGAVIGDIMALAQIVGIVDWFN